MNILFVCTGNMCRSPAAELFLRKRLKEEGISGVEVSSAGVGADEGRPCPPDTLQALKRRGVDGRSHRSRPLTAGIVQSSDLILAMTEAHQTAVELRFPGSQGKVDRLKSYAGLGGDVDDPFDGGPEAQDICLAEIASALDGVVKKLKEEGGNR
jgi:protein-tyrosine phosphatase